MFWIFYVGYLSGLRGRRWRGRGKTLTGEGRGFFDGVSREWYTAPAGQRDGNGDGPGWDWSVRVWNRCLAWSVHVPSSQTRLDPRGNQMGICSPAILWLDTVLQLPPASKPQFKLAMCSPSRAVEKSDGKPCQMIVRAWSYRREGGRGDVIDSAARPTVRCGWAWRDDRSVTIPSLIFRTRDTDVPVGICRGRCGIGSTGELGRRA